MLFIGIAIAIAIEIDLKANQHLRACIQSLPQIYIFLDHGTD